MFLVTVTADFNHDIPAVEEECFTYESAVNEVHNIASINGDRVTKLDETTFRISTDGTPAGNPDTNYTARITEV